MVKKKNNTLNQKKKILVQLYIFKRETCNNKKTLHLSGKKHLSRMSKVGHSMYDIRIFEIPLFIISFQL